MAEHAGCRRVPAGRGVGTCLLVQPPVRQAHYNGYRLGFFKYDAMRFEQCVNIAGSAARVIRARTPRTASSPRVATAVRLSASGGEKGIIRIAASLAAGHHVSLRDVIPGLDQRNLELVTIAIRRAAGQRP